MRFANARCFTRLFCTIGLPALFISPAAHAGSIFNYEIAINSFISNPNPSVFGTSTMETISFDNGNSTNINQTYSFANIVGVTVTSIGGTFSITGPETLSFAGNPLDEFATTDAQGMLQLTPPFSVGVITTDSVTASINGGDESVSLSKWWVTGTWQGEHSALAGASFGALTAVPEPTSLMLFAAGGALIAAGSIRRRNPARR
jgi:hypothetical protein